LKHILSLHEFFDTGIFGDTYGYGGANGIFKVAYKPYKDLSVSVGPDPKVPRNIPGSKFQVGDIVIGMPIEGKKKVAGMVVKNVLAPDQKSYKYFVQVHTKGKKEQKVMELVPDSVEFVDMGDKGHRQIVSQYKFNDLPGDVYNSKTVYNNPGLGIEAVGS
jgi:hypothetical protein